MKVTTNNSLLQFIKLVKSALNGKASSSHTHSVATTSANGLMSSTDKKKLDSCIQLKNVYNGNITSNGTYTIGDITDAKVLFVQTKDDTSGNAHTQCMPFFPTTTGSFISSTSQQYIAHSTIRFHFSSATKLVVDDINGSHIYRIDMMY